MADFTLMAKLLGDASSFNKAFSTAQNKLKDVQKNVKSFSDKTSKWGSELSNKITKPAMVATSALAGITLVKGFGRLAGIDTARAKMQGLGHDAQTVEAIMDSALESVKGTSFGMDEAATTAANAVAAGIQPGKDLTRYLTITGDAAAIAGSSMSDMGSIINKVQTAQKAYTGELNQLSDRGIPIYQWVAKEAGITAEQVRDMASSGKLSSEMFLSAIENNIGGAAKTMGENSFTAAVANIGAAIGRIGANFLDAGGEGGGFFSTVKPMLTDFIGVLDGLAPIATDLGVKFGSAFQNAIDKISSVISWFRSLDDSTQSMIGKIAGISAVFLVGLGPALKIVGALSGAFSAVAGVLAFLMSPIGLIVGALVGLGIAFGVAWNKSEEFRNKVTSAIEKVREIATNVVERVKGIFVGLFDGGESSAQDLLGVIGGKFLSVFETVISVVSSLVDGVMLFVGGLMDGFSQAGGSLQDLSSLFILFNPIQKIAMMILKDFGPQIAQGFSEIMSMAMPILTLLGQTLGELAASVIPLVMNVVATLIPIIITLGTTIAEIVMAVLPVLLTLFQQIVPVVMSLVTTIIDLVTQMLPLVQVIIGSLIPVFVMVVDVILNIVQSVAPALIAIIGAVIAIFQAIMPVVMMILNVVINVMANIISAITPIIAFIAGVITTIISIIAPIVTFIAGVIASIFKAITPIIVFVTGVFSTVFTIISGVFRSVNNFIAGVISSVSSTISRLSGTVSGVFNGIWSTISKIMDRVSSKISGVFSAIQNSWSGLTTFFSNIFSGIGDNMEKLVGQIKRFINGVVGGINSAIGIINKIPGVKIGKIPMLQRGTDDWEGGFARINEGGRGELVNLPNGAQVVPHDVSMRYAKEAGRANSQPVVISSSNDSAESILSSIGPIELVLPINGREFAKETYEDMWELIQFNNKRNNKFAGTEGR